MARPSLSLQMSARIIEHIRENNLPCGHHLPAQTLADALRVSRAPIAAALKRLEELKIVRSEPYRGYFLAKDASELAKEGAPSLSDKEPEDSLMADTAPAAPHSGTLGGFAGSYATTSRRARAPRPTASMKLQRRMLSP